MCCKSKSVVCVRCVQLPHKGDRLAHSRPATYLVPQGAGQASLRENEDVCLPLLRNTTLKIYVNAHTDIAFLLQNDRNTIHICKAGRFSHKAQAHSTQILDRV